MHEQLTRYKTRRQACTLPDGTRPYSWWKRYQHRIGGAKTMSEAEIRKDAARHAKELESLAGGDE